MPDLKATYTSTSSSSSSPSSLQTQTFTHALPSFCPASTSPASAEFRTAALAELSLRLKDLQADINTFLTEKMVEDRAAAAATAVEGGKRKRDEEEFERLERGYGEEDGEGM